MTTFVDITRGFLEQFTTCIAKAKHPINLLGVTQRSGVPTRRYLGRFNDECLEIDGLTDSVASLCLTNRLLNEDFKETPHYQTCMDHARNPKCGERVHQRRKGQSSGGGQQMIADKGILSKPRQLKDRTGGNKNLYCDYHKGFGHKTQDWFDLKDALEQAIREGKMAEFSQFIREPKRRGCDRSDDDKSRIVKPMQEPKEDNDRGLTVVNVVVGRDAAPRSKSAAKKDAKVLAVSSTSHGPSRPPEEPQEYHSDRRTLSDIPENPPMVITTRVGTGLVKRILVETAPTPTLCSETCLTPWASEKPT
ncbi:uncharacterized protein LOC130949192 [Arachis stenosperma]|uniref:uncharacterized protein LOC130949192 n=1 Tax=Arachis stenosperma TaxID=217475 RepID=UPI0025AC67EB|nr:uncharacterized protein LOC130949192 [Arachis stenosperma]